MKISRDPYNMVGRLILIELAYASMTYKFACKVKLR